MTTEIVKKATQPAFIIGGLLLIFMGAFVASASQMSLGKNADGSAKEVNKYARVGLGMLILFCGLIIAYKGIMKGAQVSAA